MSVPLDRLYNFLHGVVDHDITIYRFWPHGSKKLEDLLPVYPMRPWPIEMTTPQVIFHDQEPLNFHYWTTDDFVQYWHCVVKQLQRHRVYQHHEVVQHAITAHLRTACHSSIFDYIVLVHSEKHSQAIETYFQHGFLPVYYWSHAMLAADWFRYAAHDPVLQYKANQFTQDFLIYNRAWTGTREYRLTFVDQLIQAQLLEHCRISFTPQDSGIHYTKHQFANVNLAITRTDIETMLSQNTHDAAASADYNNQDYATTGMEIVLETIFDDSRWHLTEKALRPIACGKPFMLVATAGSLQYLRSYGFETFAGHIDESYDLVVDPVARLSAVIKEMTRISALSSVDKIELWHQLHEIAARNKQRFFSAEWQAAIVQEYCDNMDQAMITMRQNCSAKRWQQFHQNISVANAITTQEQRDYVSNYLGSK